MSTFTPHQQKAIVETANSGTGVFTAHAADSGYTPQEREAFRVLATSTQGSIGSAPLPGSEGTASPPSA